jgi:hypothetical protein
MTSFASIIVTTALLVLGSSISQAELPGLLKPLAEQYDRSIKGLDESTATQRKAASDAYSAVLKMARKREEAAGRPAGVTAIDAEIAAVAAGPLPAKAPDTLPADLGVYRDRYIKAAERAVSSTAGPRRFATEDYLKALSKMEAMAKGKDEALYKAALAEKERVAAGAQALTQEKK